MQDQRPCLLAWYMCIRERLYSTVCREEYPDLVCNFLPAVVSVALLFGIGSRMLSRKSQLPE
ncbi:DUF1422 family protein [Enterobacter hormaechei]